MPLSQFKPACYDALLTAKIRTVRTLLSDFDTPEPEVFCSKVEAFRMRAEFRIWHEGDELNYVMFRPEDRKTPVPVKYFPIACQRIQDLMEPLRNVLRNEDVLRRKLFQVEFLSTQTGDTLITLVYHRKLDDVWTARAKALAQEFDVALVGRSRKQKIVIGRDYVTECLDVAGRSYYYRQYEQAFSQPNAQVNIQMLEWALACADIHSNKSVKDTNNGDLLELYCGNGNFSLPLSTRFNQLIATELSKSAIQAAQWGLQYNGIENVQMIRLSAEEISQAISGERVFRRLAKLPKPLQDYHLKTVFVDPPRAGLDSETENMVSTFERILYISCNPQTLANNLTQLSRSHRISRFALFDQFPYTQHMECGVLLEKH
ncbi:MAG: tRNA (uridine(54)-C5)-methyltransferase TrmA [Parahaliea sp.]